MLIGERCCFGSCELKADQLKLKAGQLKLKVGQLKLKADQLIKLESIRCRLGLNLHLERVKKALFAWSKAALNVLSSFNSINFLCLLTLF